MMRRREQMASSRYLSMLGAWAAASGTAADVERRDKAAEMDFDGILLKPITTAAFEQTLLGEGGNS